MKKWKTFSKGEEMKYLILVLILGLLLTGCSNLEEIENIEDICIVTNNKITNATKVQISKGKCNFEENKEEEIQVI